ncbi:MAG TPA: CHASE2 domain-containing protein [Casimicrobiaceae bacterium]|nr:CHASE2 domain-containing protein [Casimicrobiaceae bacterium]
MTGAGPEKPELRTARVRAIAGALTIAFAAALALDLARASPLAEICFDAYQRLSPRPVSSLPATIVAIDDASLEKLGRWPWPRTLLATLVRRIAAFSPGAIGLDIVMPEPDPLSPARAFAHVDVDAALRARIDALPSNDADLAAALRATPSVLAMVGAVAPTAEPLRVTPILVGGTRDEADRTRALAKIFDYPAALSSIAVLTDAAHGFGLISADDPQGVVRTVPLVANVGGTLVPGFGVEMWRVALGVPALRASVDDATLREVRVGRDAFRVDANGSVRPWFSLPRSERFVSAADVLAGTATAAKLHRSFVLIGVTGLALGDYAWTPVGKMPGAEIHAQTLENMASRAFLARPAFAPLGEAFALLAAAGLLIAVVPRVPVATGSAIAGAAFAAIVALGYGAFRAERWLFDAATPAVMLAVVFATLLGLQLADANRHRKALARVLQREREEAARVAGELQAARRIQLGTLPQPDAVHDPRVDIAAVMEAAQEVGGDLYDFYRLDGDRLLFMLGDVSGKGLSASIFMAVSKALCKSTVLRAPDADLGALLSRANVEVGRDNAAAFFVTVFAAVLDLRTGVLDYCNAGHENPWRRAAATGALARLCDGGGPPLCVVDDFDYGAARVALAPGDFVCIVSDGVTEANDARGAMYGAARVEALLARAGSARAAVDGLCDDVRAFAHGTAAYDDMTVLAVQWRGPAVAA